jgi:release factor glutamine methyltransferase
MLLCMNDERPHPGRWTVRDILAWTTDYFRNKGIPTPRLDAEILLAHCLDRERIYLYLNLDRPLQSAERSRYRELVGRRASREPIALITGVKEFWSIPFRISPGVLIPRPETEVLVEAIIDQMGDLTVPRVLELGTGSGAVAVSVAKENKRVHILASDINPSTLRIASLNALQVGVTGSIEFLASDLFSAIRPGTTFDVICSNPPYVPRDLIPTLEPEVRDFEPHAALDGGPDGLDVIRKLARQARHYLKESGALVLEIGEGQEESVIQILTSIGGFRETRSFMDLSGKPRVVKAKI